MDASRENNDLEVSQRDSQKPVQHAADAQVTRAYRMTRRRGGELKYLLDMHIDILIEIFSLLHPRDLLHLARTSKTLRRFLLNRNFATIWRAAFRLVEGFPACPSFMSAPAYANVAFSSHCHNCLKTGIKTVVWQFMVRYCPKCRKLKFIEVDSVRLDKDLMDQVSILVSDESGLDESGLEELGPEELGLEYIYSKVLNYKNQSIRKPTLWHLPQIAQVNSTWAALAGDARKRFLLQLIEEVQQRKKHATLCQLWEATIADSRTCELNKIRESRRKAIVNKLRKLGWGSELERVGPSFTLHPLVYAPKELTENEWLKIRQEMIAFMEKKKEGRLVAERRHVIWTRFKAFSPVVFQYHSAHHSTSATACLPDASDFALMPVIRDVLNLPSDVKVDADDLAKLQILFPLLVSRWVVDAMARLSRLLVKKTDVPDDVDCLDLAVAVFECNCCDKLSHFPEVLAHRCLRPWFNGADKELDEYATVVKSQPRRYRPVVAFRAIDRIRKVLQECGKDWTETTIEDMDNPDIRLCCTISKKPDYRVITTWRLMLDTRWMQGLQIGADDSILSWRVATMEETTMAKEIEDRCQHLALKEYEEQYAWCCSLCERWMLYTEDLPEVKRHLRASHSIADPSEEAGHFQLHPEGRPLTPVWTVMYHRKPKVSKLRGPEKKLYKEGRTCFLPLPQ